MNKRIFIIVPLIFTVIAVGFATMGKAMADSPGPRATPTSFPTPSESVFVGQTDGVLPVLSEKTPLVEMSEMRGVEVALETQPPVELGVSGTAPVEEVARSLHAALPTDGVLPLP